MYLFKDDIDSEGFVWWSKKFILSKQWALLPNAAKAVYPVIAIHCDKNGYSYPKERTIAIISGRTDKVARQAIRDIENFLGESFEIFKYISKRGKRSKRFKLKIPAYTKGDTFPFYRWIFQSGIWQELKPTAQALYPVMRSFGYYSEDSIIESAEELGSDELWKKGVYKNRRFDLCSADYDVLAEYAGISYRSINQALNSLERNFLIDWDQENEAWQVFLKSKDMTSYKRRYLNEKIMKSYNHVLKNKNRE
jgi:hypothetical protein